MATIEDFESKQAHKPLAEYTLEEMITEGESDEKDKAEKPEQKSINCMPHYLIAIINELCRQHQKLGIGEAQRLTAKLGQAVIQDRFGKLIEQIADRRSVIFQKTDPVLLHKSFNTNKFQFKETIGANYKKCSLRVWLISAISDRIAEPLNISFSTAVLLVLLAGISRSELWIPRGWVKVANKELDNFQHYLEDQLKTLGELLKE
jgi:hypothetical protein